MTEDKLLAQCHQWLWNNYPKTRYLCAHIANERKTNPAQGAIFKAKGVLAGYPDYVIHWQGKTYFFEFKSTIGKLSPEQINVRNALIDQGFAWFEIRNFETFVNIVENIIHNIA